jgi:hypothetical protein
MIRHDQLDIPICELHEGATNTETMRDFIRNSEHMFEMAPKDIDTLSEEELNKYIDFLDYLWEK